MVTHLKTPTFYKAKAQPNNRKRYKRGYTQFMKPVSFPAAARIGRFDETAPARPQWLPSIYSEESKPVS